ELDLIRQITREFSTLARTELAHTICQLLQWRRPNGGLKSRECYFFLQALHAHGWLPWLPPPQLRTRRPRLPSSILRPRRKLHSPAGCGQYLPLRLQLLENRSQRRLLQHSIQRYHYLGYRVPYGAQLRYFVRSPQPPYPLLACLPVPLGKWPLLSGAAPLL